MEKPSVDLPYLKVKHVDSGIMIHIDWPAMAKRCEEMRKSSLIGIAMTEDIHIPIRKEPDETEV